jgi:transcriptional regulator with XRE-family HTH domain
MNNPKKNILKFDSRIVNKSQIARKLGLSRSYVVMLLSGERTNPERIQEIKNLLQKELKAA